MLSRTHMLVGGGFVAGVLATCAYRYVMGVRALNAAAAAAPSPTAPVRAASTQVMQTN